MKYLAICIVTLAFLILAASILFPGNDGWGWCISGAFFNASNRHSIFERIDKNSEKDEFLVYNIENQLFVHFNKILLFTYKKIYMKQINFADELQ